MQIDARGSDQPQMIHGRTGRIRANPRSSPTLRDVHGCSAPTVRRFRPYILGGVIPIKCSGVGVRTLPGLHGLQCNVVFLHYFQLLLLWADHLCRPPGTGLRGRPSVRGPHSQHPLHAGSISCCTMATCPPPLTSRPPQSVLPGQLRQLQH